MYKLVKYCNTFDENVRTSTRNQAANEITY